MSELLTANEVDQTIGSYNIKATETYLEKKGGVAHSLTFTELG